jgi:hypothetical protein
VLAVNNGVDMTLLGMWLELTHFWEAISLVHSTTHIDNTYFTYILNTYFAFLVGDARLYKDGGP